MFKKRPPLNFEQNCLFPENEKSKFKETSKKEFVDIKNTSWNVVSMEKHTKSAKKVKNISFDT